MKTCSSYIHEHDCLDNFTEFMMEASQELENIQNKFNSDLRQFELALVFESSKEDDHLLFMEAENDSLLGKIGTVVTNLLKQIAEFIRDITKSFTGSKEEVKDEMAIVSDLMRDHPEIAMDIAKGLNKSWFTYHDVAKFENDVAGLVNMLKKQEIDHKTFSEKISDKCAAFTKIGYPIIRGTVTAGGIIALPNILVKKCMDSSKALSSISEMIKAVQEVYRNNREVHNAGPAASAVNALAKVAHLVAKECEDRNATQSKFAQLLAKVTKGKIDIKRSPQAQLKWAANKAKREAKHLAREQRKEREAAEAEKVKAASSE